MRITISVLFTLSVTLILGGCSVRERSEPTKSTNGTVATPSAFSSRLEAAQAIFDSNERDKAHAQLALDAADAGDANVTKGAIGAIFSQPLRDDSTRSAALRLAKAGKGDDAVAIAKTIFDSNRRDETLAKIAKGETSE